MDENMMMSKHMLPPPCMESVKDTGGHRDVFL